MPEKVEKSDPVIPYTPELSSRWAKPLQDLIARNGDRPLIESFDLIEMLLLVGQIAEAENCQITEAAITETIRRSKHRRKLFEDFLGDDSVDVPLKLGDENQI